MKRCLVFILTLTFSSSLFLPLAKADSILLPPVGQRLALSTAFTPVMLKGVIPDPKDPFKFNFIVDSGDTGLSPDQLNTEGMKLIKYFLSALAVPEEDMWVNLSPYEKNRVIAKSFGDTEMGRDMLAQDYILKQLSASLTYPEGDLGRKFWDAVYAKVQAKYGNVNIPVDTFNKVWIAPDKAEVYEQKNGVFVVEARLKVMLESDYLATRVIASEAKALIPGTASRPQSKIATMPTASRDDIKAIVRDIVLPELEREVNGGAHFSGIRQAYQAMILAAWYKIRLKESILGKLYVNQAKINGIALEDKAANQKIYDQYVQAFKKGVYNYIKEVPQSDRMVPRKYFSGGVNMITTPLIEQSLKRQDPAMRARVQAKGNVFSIMVNTLPENGRAMGTRYMLLENNPNDIGGEDAIYMKQGQITEKDKEELARLMQEWRLNDRKNILDKLETLRVGRPVQIYYMEREGEPAGVLLVVQGFQGKSEYVFNAQNNDRSVIRGLVGAYEKMQRKDAAMLSQRDLQALGGQPLVGISTALAVEIQTDYPAYIEYLMRNKLTERDLTFLRFYQDVERKDLKAAMEKDYKMQTYELLAPMVSFARNLPTQAKGSLHVVPLNAFRQVSFDELREFLWNEIEPINPGLFKVLEVEARAVMDARGFVNVQMLADNMRKIFEDEEVRKQYRDSFKTFIRTYEKIYHGSRSENFMPPLLQERVPRIYPHDSVLRLAESIVTEALQNPQNKGKAFFGLTGLERSIKIKDKNALHEAMEADFKAQVDSLLRGINDHFKRLRIQRQNTAGGVVNIATPRRYGIQDFYEYVDKNIFPTDKGTARTLNTIARRLAGGIEGTVDINELYVAVHREFRNEALTLYEAAINARIHAFSNVVNKENESPDQAMMQDINITLGKDIKHVLSSAYEIFGADFTRIYSEKPGRLWVYDFVSYIENHENGGAKVWLERQIDRDVDKAIEIELQELTRLSMFRVGIMGHIKESSIIERIDLENHVKVLLERKLISKYVANKFLEIIPKKDIKTGQDIKKVDLDILITRLERMLQQDSIFRSAYDYELQHFFEALINGNVSQDFAMSANPSVIKENGGREVNLDIKELFTRYARRYSVYLAGRESRAEHFKNFLKQDIVLGEQWQDKLFNRYITYVLDQMYLSKPHYVQRDFTDPSKSYSKRMLVQDLREYIDGNIEYQNIDLYKMVLEAIKKKDGLRDIVEDGWVDSEILSERVHHLIEMNGNLYKVKFLEQLEATINGLYGNQAMAVNGGIDLNANNVALQIKRDAQGFVLPIANQPLSSMQINGLFPIILNITPVASLSDYLN